MTHHTLLVIASAAAARTVRRILLRAGAGRFKMKFVSRTADACNRPPYGPRTQAIVVDPFCADSQGIDTIHALLRAPVSILILGSARYEGEFDPLSGVHGRPRLSKQRTPVKRSLSSIAKSMLARSALAEAQFMEGVRARMTLDSIGDAVISTDVAGNITYLNTVAESLTGWSKEEACGQPLRKILHIIDGVSRETAPDPLAMAIRRNEATGLSANSVLIRRDGYESAIEDTATPIHDGKGATIGAVIVFRDVSVARAMSLRMSYLAQHDFLTELPNRMLLNDRLTQAMSAALRHNTSLAVLFVDVDHFKPINDAQGHAIGDALLKSISHRLVACVRTTDTVSRHGGDEFVVLLSEVTRKEDAAVSAEKILTALRIPHRVLETDLQITASVGISVFPDNGTDADTLIRNADTALLHAKESGRDRHAFFEPGARSRKNRASRNPYAECE